MVLLSEEPQTSENRLALTSEKLGISDIKILKLNISFLIKKKIAITENEKDLVGCVVKNLKFLKSVLRYKRNL